MHLCLSAGLAHAQEIYWFDTINDVTFARDDIRIEGFETDTGIALVVAFEDRGSGSRVMTRCVPLVLTAIEKTGRYFLRPQLETDDRSRHDLIAGSLVLPGRYVR